MEDDETRYAALLAALFGGLQAMTDENNKTEQEQKPGVAVNVSVTVYQQRLDQLRDLFKRAEADIAKVIPKHLTAEKLLKIALVAAGRNPLLLQCTPASVLQGVMQAAQLGLDVGGVTGSAYLVPYRNNKKGGRYEAQMIPGYRGLIDLARRSGRVLGIEAHVVHKGDEFELMFGSEPKLVHRPKLDGPAGEVIGAYAVAFIRDGNPQTEFMTLEQLEGIRKRSRASDNGPWVTDREEMQRKTAVRRLAKYLPLSPEDQLAKAIEIEDRAESGDLGVQVLLPEDEPGPESVAVAAEADEMPAGEEAPKSKTEELKKDLKSKKDRQSELV
jgi:recombination protein RecT